MEILEKDNLSKPAKKGSPRMSNEILCWAKNKISFIKNKRDKNNKNCEIPKEEKTLLVPNLLNQDKVVQEIQESSNFTYKSSKQPLHEGLSSSVQKTLCKNWKEGKLWGLKKCKPVGEKAKPVNKPIPQALNPPLEKSESSRDPYKTPLTPFPPDFQPIKKVTEGKLKTVLPVDLEMEKYLELHGTGLKRSMSASHIKKFFPSARTLEEIQQDEDQCMEEEKNQQKENQGVDDSLVESSEEGH